MLKNRIAKLEQITKYKMWIPPKVIHQDGDGWHTKDGQKLLEDGERYLFEDGRVYFEPTDNPDFVELIRICFVGGDR